MKKSKSFLFSYESISIYFLDIVLLILFRKERYLHVIIYTIILSLLVLFLGIKFLPEIAQLLFDSNVKGIDLHKTDRHGYNNEKCLEFANAKEKKQIFLPESGGLLIGLICLLVYFIMFGVVDKLGEGYDRNMLGAIMSICYGLLIGFIDDIIDVKWRYKIILPIVTAVPLAHIYNGSTNVRLPRFIVQFFDKSKKFSELDLIEYDLKSFYKVYIILMMLCCYNGINIYAGLNGLEVGQTIVILIFVIIYNTIEILMNNVYQATLSLIFSLIFLHGSVALFHYNKYPAVIFVGNSFTAMAGAHFGATSIIGHFTKTLALLTIPQIFNLIYSLPQLLKIVPCPRHRMPFSCKNTGLLYSSKNLTLINLWLEIKKPMTEKKLFKDLMYLQVVCCSIGLMIRYSKIYLYFFQ